MRPPSIIKTLPAAKMMRPITFIFLANIGLMTPITNCMSYHIQACYLEDNNTIQKRKKVRWNWVPECTVQAAAP